MDKRIKELAKLAFINRQPTLFRHGIATVKIIPSDDDDDETIGLSPLTLEPFNSDFDGDTNALYLVHDKDALAEMEEKSYIKNTIMYDSDDSMLAVIRHEALYAAYILTENLIPIKEEPIEISTLQNLFESIDWYNEKLNYPILCDDELYTYGLCLLNKWCGFDIPHINKTITKNEADYVSRTIYEYFEHDNEVYYDHLTNLDKRLLFFISATKYCPSVNVTEMNNVLDSETEKLFKKLPDNNITLGYCINEGLLDRCLKKFNRNTQLYKLYKSGSRFSKQQLARSAINIGYSADDNNIVVPKPIKTTLLKGMTPEEFFLSSPGTRKGIADKSKFTPQSGYLERTMVMALSPLEIVEEDCLGSGYLKILVFSEKHSRTLVGKYFQDPYRVSDWKVLDYETAKSYINREILIRSPITCSTPNFRMCRKCFGEKKLPTNYPGIVAGQLISERLTQLILRSFHTSGSADLNVPQTSKDFIKDHLVDIENINEQIILHFDTSSLSDQETLMKIKGFDRIEHNKMIFNADLDEVKNKDVVSIMFNIKELLKSKKLPEKTPAEYYEEMMGYILSVGTPYSSFVEMFFANMFIVDEQEQKFWRYHQDQKILKKLSDKTVAKNISKLLGLLYEPNKQTLEKLTTFDDIDLEKEAKSTIYGRIWLGEFS